MYPKIPQCTHFVFLFLLYQLESLGKYLFGKLTKNVILSKLIKEGDSQISCSLSS